MKDFPRNGEKLPPLWMREIKINAFIDTDDSRSLAKVIKYGLLKKMNPLKNWLKNMEKTGSCFLKCLELKMESKLEKDSLTNWTQELRKKIGANKKTGKFWNYIVK